MKRGKVSRIGEIFDHAQPNFRGKRVSAKFYANTQTKIKNRLISPSSYFSLITKGVRWK